MFFIYDENSKKGGSFSPMDFDPNKMYKKHIENWYFLNFIITNSNDFHEKVQARKEIMICDRKQQYWKKHLEFDNEIAIQDLYSIKNKWIDSKKSINK